MDFLKFQRFHRIIFSLTLVMGFHQLYSQTEVVNIGNFYTERNQLIPNCKIGYTSIGVRNASSSNVILVPTWYTGSSSEVLVSWASQILDTGKYYILVVDALGNGISSSPSNTPNFPSITMGDMVKATHQLLDDVMHVHQLYAVVGASMGGMQAFQWGVQYPLFVGKLISVAGTPKQSTYDIMQWKIFSSILSGAANQQGRSEAMETYAHALQLSMRTPDYWNQRFPTTMADSLLSGASASLNNRMKTEDYLAQMNAMMTHNVERYSKVFNNHDMLVVVAVADHFITPDASLDFARKNQLTAYVLQGIDGHMLALTQTKKLGEVLKQFLK